MKHKRSDFALTVMAVMAMALGIFAYFKNRHPATQLGMKQNLPILAVIRESDCVECVQKVVCYWDNLAMEFNAQKIETQLIFWRESEVFQTEELGFLCQIPADLQVREYQKIKGALSIPMATPPVMVTNGEKILYLEPIFLQTDMKQVHQRIATAIGLHLPTASL